MRVCGGPHDAAYRVPLRPRPPLQLGRVSRHHSRVLQVTTGVRHVPDNVHVIAQNGPL